MGNRQYNQNKVKPCTAPATWNLSGMKFNDISRAEYLSRFRSQAKARRIDHSYCGIRHHNIASAKTEIDTGKDVFTDYFNLIKTNEGWFIVDKIAVRKSK